MPIAAFASAMVRSAAATSGLLFKQFRRYADRNWRRRNRHRPDGDGEIGGSLAQKYGDRVFKLRSRDCNIGRARLRAAQRGFSFDHGDLVVDARFIERTRQFIRFLICRNGIVKNLLQLVLAANFEKNSARLACSVRRSFSRSAALTWAA